jgi:hypothetical protein
MNEIYLNIYVQEIWVEPLTDGAIYGLQHLLVGNLIRTVERRVS